jgi:hypothetical protein
VEYRYIITLDFTNPVFTSEPSIYGLDGRDHIGAVFFFNILFI